MLPWARVANAKMWSTTRRAQQPLLAQQRNRATLARVISSRCWLQRATAFGPSAFSRAPRGKGSRLRNRHTRRGPHAVQDRAHTQPHSTDPKLPPVHDSHKAPHRPSLQNSHAATHRDDIVLAYEETPPTVGRGEIRSRHAEIGMLSGITQAGARTRWNVSGDDRFTIENNVFRYKLKNDNEGAYTRSGDMHFHANARHHSVPPHPSPQLAPPPHVLSRAIGLHHSVLPHSSPPPGPPTCPFIQKRVTLTGHSLTATSRICVGSLLR